MPPSTPVLRAVRKDFLDTYLKETTMNLSRLFSVFASLLLLTACGVAPYQPPQEKEPYALLKLKYKYSEGMPGTTLGARMNIRHGAQSEDESFQVAWNERYGAVTKKTRPDIPTAAVKVHPGKKTDLDLAVYFFWYTTHTYTTMINNVPQVQTQQVYNERACTVRVSFTPKPGKVYLVDYSSPNVGRDCRANAYEQVKQGGGTFKLLKVGTSKTL